MLQTCHVVLCSASHAPVPDECLVRAVGHVLRLQGHPRHPLQDGGGVAGVHTERQASEHEITTTSHLKTGGAACERQQPRKHLPVLVTDTVLRVVLRPDCN
jgi:hypothetical protein